MDLGKPLGHKLVMRQTNYYSPNNCQDQSLSVSRTSLPSMLRKGPLQHALQPFCNTPCKVVFYSVAWFPMEKDSSLFKRPLATNLAKTLCLPQFFCVVRLCCTLCCRVFCHTGSAVSQKPVQHAFCAPACGWWVLAVRFVFCCTNVAHVVVVSFSFADVLGFCLVLPFDPNLAMLRCVGRQHVHINSAMLNPAAASQHCLKGARGTSASLLRLSGGPHGET